MLSRDVRTPVRLRFGRRSDEQAVPHLFPNEVNILKVLTIIKLL